MSRGKNSLRNFLASSVGEGLTMILKFATRTVFIYTLGASYLGINGLFTNILEMLSLTELGVARAMNFQLYKPLAERDENRICVLIKFYKTIYNIIGLVVLGLGLCLIPALPYLINDYDSLANLHINAILIYLMYLLQNVSTYLFFAYKSALIKADQKEYKLTIAGYGVTIITYGVQILILVFMQNFILYTACLVLSVIVQNLINAFIVDREYPYIKEKTDEKLSISEVKGIFKDCYALFIYKINTVVLNATDNIVISAFIGLAVVGEYSNYMMIYNQIKVIMIKFFNAIKASMGNLHATESVDVEYLFFKALNLLTVIGYGTAAVGIAVVGDSFIRAWIGDDYVLGSLFCLLMGVEIYILGIRQLMGAFRNTMGLFQQGKYRPLLSIILNIIISIVLVRPLGLYGVMLGTIISDSATMLWIDPLVLYRYGFKNYRPLKEYFFRNGLYLLALLGSGAIAQIACNQIKGIGWISVIAKMGVSTVVTCSIFMIISYRSEEFAYLKNTIKRLMK